MVLFCLAVQAGESVDGLLTVPGIELLSPFVIDRQCIKLVMYCYLLIFVFILKQLLFWSLLLYALLLVNGISIILIFLTLLFLSLRG